MPGALSLAQTFSVGALHDGILGSHSSGGIPLSLSLSTPAAAFAALSHAGASPQDHSLRARPSPLIHLCGCLRSTGTRDPAARTACPRVPPINDLGMPSQRGLPCMLFVWGLARILILVAYWAIPARIAPFTVIRTPLPARPSGSTTGSRLPLLQGPPLAGPPGAVLHHKPVRLPETPEGFGSDSPCP